MNNNKNKNFDYIKVSLASPEKIRSWSNGEVKKPETINYRTFKPERDGLFCAKIFGPIKDYECLCGKYKKIKYKNLICEKCGVEVTKTKIRRERMGHIELATPISHIWFLKSMPSKIGLLLDLSIKELEKIIYYESYIVIKSNIKDINVGKIIFNNKYTLYKNDIFNGNLVLKIGAEAIQILLKNIDLEKEYNKSRDILKKSNSDYKKNKIIKKINLIKSFIKSKNKPEWMILNVLPILPPDLRPLVPLDGGRFATSDLNDLYRRVINRNNRLKKLIKLSAPNIIIKNEKKMLQESIDSLLDNGRQEKVTITSNKRQLKSLSDMIKGKQGRFRQNLLGKRVDYSGRSVITVGPYLKLNQCGLPKKMALELFKPFIYNKLIKNGISNNLKTSKKIVDDENPIVWDILLDIIKDYPILLNRAPTLHRLGIQSFYPILIEGKSIQLHPLVCTAYNADFDGDQMAIHIPLSIESKLESKILMMSNKNILSPANGEPVIVPSQDIILGLYYMTISLYNNFDNNIYSDINEIKTLYNLNYIKIHQNINFRIKEYSINKNYNIDNKNNNKYIKNINIVKTTVGRILLWDIIPKGLEFEMINKNLDKKNILNLIDICYKKLGNIITIKFIDDIMNIGFLYSTKSGISVCLNDLKIPKNKNFIIERAKSEVCNIQEQYQIGLISKGDRYNKIIDIWSEVSDKITDDIIKEISEVEFEKETDTLYLNSIYMMINSGSRGSYTQIRQLIGIRGLMTKPDGTIIETPITSNFKEGLNIIQYFISTHGTRKGLSDTALKTANSGYLTRRLVDVSQDLVINNLDCKTNNGIYLENIIENNKLKDNIYNKILGRFLSKNIFFKSILIFKKNTLINENIIYKIENFLINNIFIRSAITCENKFGICSYCYGIDLSTKKIIIQGESIGVIAAQSIGEPGTQLTMRTFHIGGAVSSNVIETNSVISKQSGKINIDNLIFTKNTNNNNIVISKNSYIYIENNNIKNVYKIPYGSIINDYIINNKFIENNVTLAKYDPYNVSILSEINGITNFVNIKKNKTAIYKIDELTGLNKIIILEFSKRDIKYRNIISYIEILENKRNKNFIYEIPEKAIIQIKNNEYINKGDVIAIIPKNFDPIKDITGGLPKISDIFEVRTPKNKCILAEKSGTLKIINNYSKNKIKVNILKNNIVINEFIIPKCKQLKVLDGENIKKGDLLSEGQIYLKDILRLRGLNSLINFIIDEIQSIYRIQGVKINDKHIEVIIKQMIKKVIIIDKGDSNLKKNSKYYYSKVIKINNMLKINNKKLIKFKYILLGITKSSLITDSFISSASFQETTRVLTDSAISGKKDMLRGLKENVIVGRLIPAGTGYNLYQIEEKFKKK